MSINARMRRAVGIAAGTGTHLLFAFTVWRLFWFLKSRSGQLYENWMLMDAALALQFAIPHSVLLLPSTRRKINLVIGRAFYGLLFCVATCFSLLLLFAFWRTSATPIWSLSSFASLIVNAAFIGAWLALLYSINLTGLGYQTGLTPWLHWLRGQPQPRRGFTPRGAYLWIRHPVYLSFLGLIWFQPAMSLDRLLLAAIWSGYIAAGSYLKDERLAFYVGESYREYQTRVTGFPLMFFGPLAKRRPLRRAKVESPFMTQPTTKTSKMAA